MWPVAGCTRMPELRAGNATVNAKGGETLASLQEAAGLAGQWLPVDAHGQITIADLCLSRDGGPREARYGPLRGRVLSLGARGLRFGTEAVKDVAGYDVRRAWLGQILIAHATLRLAAHPSWRTDALLRGGDAFALAETLRALPSAPAAILVLSPDLVAISDDAPAAEADRRESDLAEAAAGAGAEIERIDKVDWVGRCDALPRTRVRLAGRDACVRLAGLDEPWVYDAGRRLALVREEASAARIAPARRGPEPSRELIARVGAAIAP
jgi:FAD/FMN-containing dehydrogenase